MPQRVVYSAELIGKRQTDAFVLIEDDLFTITYIYLHMCAHTRVHRGQFCGFSPLFPSHQFWDLN